MSTAFGVQTIDLAAVYVFDITYKCVYRHPEGKGDTVIIIDKSGSMDDLQDVMRLIVSAIKCMAPESRGQWDVPAPGRCTALVDSFDQIVEKHIREGELPPDARLRVMVVTDGIDNASKSTHLRFEEEQGGDMVTSTRPFPPLPTTDNREEFERAWVDAGHGREGLEEAWDAEVKLKVAARCTAVADHVAASGAELIVLGVGTAEVKDFVNACTKTRRYITTAMLERTASDADVAAVVSTSVRKSRARHACARERKEEALADNNETHITAATAEAVEPQELRTMAAETKRTTTAKERIEHAKKDARQVGEGPAFNSELQLAYVDYVVEKCCEHLGVSPAPVKAVVSWFMRYVREHPTEGIPIALVGGRLFPYPKADAQHEKRPGAVFNTPDEQTKDTRWSGAINRSLEALTYDPTDLPAHFLVFKNAKPPAPDTPLGKAILDNRVGPLFIEQQSQESFRAITKEDGLPQLGDRVLYYKHTQQASCGYYAHVRLNPRAVACAHQMPYPQNLVEQLRVVYKGNSSAERYGGPNLTPEAASESQPEAAAGSEAGGSDSEAEPLSSRSPPPPAKSTTKVNEKGHALVASLKKGKLAAEKRNRELEQENAALLRENKRMKAMIMASMGGA